MSSKTAKDKKITGRPRTRCSRIQAGKQKTGQRTCGRTGDSKRTRNIWFEQCDTDFDWYQAELAKKDRRIQDLEAKYCEMLWEYDKKILSIEEQYG